MYANKAACPRIWFYREPVCHVACEQLPSSPASSPVPLPFVRRREFFCRPEYRATHASIPTPMLPINHFTPTVISRPGFQPMFEYVVIDYRIVYFPTGRNRSTPFILTTPTRRGKRPGALSKRFVRGSRLSIICSRCTRDPARSRGTTGRFTSVKRGAACRGTNVSINESISPRKRGPIRISCAERNRN